MTGDRELLELAAKASELPVIWDDYRQGFYGGLNTYTPRHWNPITDDGDALRLAVKCEIDIDWSHAEEYETVQAYNRTQNDTRCLDFEEKFNGDPCAATRRAIVRAAAEIGREMK